MAAIAARAVADGGRPGAGRARLPRVRVMGLESSSNDMFQLYTNVVEMAFDAWLLASSNVEHVALDAQHEF